MAVQEHILNSMSKNLDEFIKEIEALGFVKKETETSNTYYVNKLGAQIRVDTSELVNIIDKFGKMKHYGSPESVMKMLKVN